MSGSKVPAEVVSQSGELSPEIALSVSIMQKGSFISKVRPNKLYRRTYFLSEDLTSLRWEPSKKRFEESKFLVSDVKRILIGQKTSSFRDTVENVSQLVDLSFSLVFNDPTAEPLDLIAETEQDFFAWTMGLTHLISTFTLSLNKMKKGAPMSKARPKKLYLRTYFLSDDCSIIRWEPSKKGEQGFIEVSQIKFLRIGQHTAAFHKAKVRHLNHLSFSLIYGDDFETLDLIAENSTDFQTWTTGLQHLVTGYSDSLTVMQTGTYVTLVTQKKKEKKLTFFLSSDFSFLRWDPGTKKIPETKILLSDIKEIRRGQATPGFQGRPDLEYLVDLSFSLVYGEQHKTIDLIAESPKDYSDWVTGLMFLVSNNPSKGGSDPARKPTITAQLESFFRENENEAKTLTYDQMVLFLHDLNIGLDIKQLKSQINRFEKSAEAPADGVVTFDAFSQFFEKLSVRREIAELIQKYKEEGDEDGSLGIEGLRKLLINEEGFDEDKASPEYCSGLIDRFETSHEGKMEGFFRAQGLADFLTTLNIFDPLHDSIYQDMDQPLSHYFISTSHNTYLLEDQLKGPSSVEAYKRALLKGCRCVELDCWDGDDGNPIVYHGFTLTSKILFSDVIDTVNEYAFKTSPYPLILSIENHCSIPQQQKMAKMMKEVFGEALAVPPVSAEMEFLPSPESLKNKVLIKGKKLTEAQIAENDNQVSDDDEEDVQSTDQKIKSLKKDAKLKGKHPLARELSDLVVYLGTKSFTPLETKEDSGKFYQMISVAEGKCRKINATDPHALVKFTRNQICRVYPAGYRVDSSNFNPQEMWNSGAQMAALNYQKMGQAMHINHGRFRQNGHCGYVLKPDVYLDPEIEFNPALSGPIPSVRSKTLSLRIVSGQNLPKPRGPGKMSKVISPFVGVEVVGLSNDCNSRRTKAVSNNGFRPYWDESFDFFLALPEIALIRVAVYDASSGSGEFIGQATLPFESLLTGYRHISLENEKGDLLANASLFVHVSKIDGGRSALWQTTQSNPEQPLSEAMGDVSKTMSRHLKMREVGIPAFDSHFRAIVPKLENAGHMREAFFVAQEKFKEILGLSLATSLKKSLEALALELEKEQTKKTLELTSVNNGQFTLNIRPNTHPSNKLKSLSKHFNSLTQAADSLLSSALVLRGEIVAGTVARNITWARAEMGKGSTRSSFTLGRSKEFPAPDMGELDSGNIEVYLLRIGFKDNRLLRAKQAFAWNVQKLLTFAHFLQDLHNQAREFTKEAAKELLQRDDVSEEDPSDAFKLLPKKTQKDEFVVSKQASDLSLKVENFSEPLSYQVSTSDPMGGKDV